MLLTLERWLSRVIALFILGGGILLLIQAFWITWGVFARYVLRDPDGVVTEATALLLVPLAFVGIAYALQEDAFPKVTMIVDKLPTVVRHWVNLFNLALMTVIGGFFTVVAGSATIRLYESGAVSSIIEWPEFALWGPVAIFIGTFTLLGVLKCALVISQQAEG